MRLKKAFLTLVLILAATTATASPIVGTLNTSGSVGIAATIIDWLPGGTGVGTFSIDPFTQSGDFLQCRTGFERAVFVAVADDVLR